MRIDGRGILADKRIRYGHWALHASLRGQRRTGGHVCADQESSSEAANAGEANARYFEAALLALTGYGECQRDLCHSVVMSRTACWSASAIWRRIRICDSACFAVRARTAGPGVDFVRFASPQHVSQFYQSDVSLRLKKLTAEIKNR